MEFRILGSVQAWADDQQVRITGARPRRLLAALLIDARRLVTTEQLIDVLWDGEPPPTARDQVHNAISALRRALSGIPVDLVTEHAGYRLTAAPEQIDAGVFTSRALDAQRLAETGAVAAAADQIGECLALWRGPALADVVSRALEPAASRLNEARLAAVGQHAQWRLVCGRHQEVAVDLADWIADHPFREELVAAWMLALFRCGRQVDALEAFRHLRARLSDEIGVEPGPELHALYAAILRQDSALEFARSAAAPTVLIPAQLPRDADGFHGRTRHLAQLDVVGSRDRPGGVVAIVGSPGVGKTALAAHWAHRVRQNFPDGQLWINLRGFTAGVPLPPMDALARFLRALGIAGENVPVDLEEASALFRTLLADRRVLIVLDNAHNAEQVRPLLPGGAATVVIITSRDRLSGLVALNGADRVQLSLLDPVEARTLLVRLVGDTVTDREAADLADGCARLPLALRIAAANLRDRPQISVAAYLEQLRHNAMSGLSIEGDEPAGVRAAFDHSYRALDAESRRLLRLAAIAPALDITVPAAAALTATTITAAASTLHRLAEAHLIDERIVGRYELHDLLRAFAAGQPTDDDDESALRRLYASYLDAVDDAATLLYPHIVRLPIPRSPSSASTITTAQEAGGWLDAERANLASLVAVAEGPANARVAWLIADAMRGYFLQNRFHTEWAQIAGAALAVAQAHDALDGQAAAHQSLGNLARGLGDYDTAARHHQQALEFADRVDWAAGQAAAHNGLGMLFWYQGRLVDTLDHYAAALAINRRIGRISGLANELSNVGVVMSDLGRLAEAAEHQREALALHREAGNRASAANALLNLGEIQRMRGLPGDAAAALAEALELGRDAGSLDLEASALEGLAALHLDLGDIPRAVGLGHQAFEVAIRTSHPRTEASVMATLATIARAEGDYPGAIAEAHRSLQRARDAGDRFSEIRAQIGLAAGHAGGGAIDDARAAIAEALVKAGDTGYRIQEIDAMIVDLTVGLAVGDDPAEQVETIRLACHETGYGLGAARLRALVDGADTSPSDPARGQLAPR